MNNSFDWVTVMRRAICRTAGAAIPAQERARSQQAGRHAANYLSHAHRTVRHALERAIGRRKRKVPGRLCQK